MGNQAGTLDVKVIFKNLMTILHYWNIIFFKTTFKFLN